MSSRCAALFAGLVVLADPGAGAPRVVNPHVVPAPVARLAAGTVIARFDGGTITAGDLDAAIAAVTGPERLEFKTPEPLREMVQGLVDRRLMAQAARAAGLDRDTVVKSRLDSQGKGAAGLAEQLLADAWLEREIAGVPGPTDSDVARYYRGHVGEFTVPVRVRVTRAVAATEAAAEKLRAALARGDSPAQLRAADPQHTVHVDEVWLQDRPKKNELETIAFGLKSSATSPVFEVETGFAVLRAEETAPVKVRPLADVRGGIEARLEEEHRQAVTARTRAALRKGIAVAVDEAALAAYVRAAASEG
jgi:peptidyl-prolyl cis-trans isomerase C